MKTALAASKYFQKTVSGTQWYAVAPTFLKVVNELKQSGTDHNLPSRAFLRRHKYFLNLPVLTLPDSLDLAATDCLRDHNVLSIKHLDQLSERLVNYLHERELLTEV